MSETTKNRLPSWAVAATLSMLSYLIIRSLVQHDHDLAAQKDLNRGVEITLNDHKHKIQAVEKEIDDVKEIIRELPFEEIRLEMRSIKSLIISLDKRYSEIEFQLKSRP